MKAMVVLFVPVIGRELSPCISHIVLSFEEGAEMGGDLDGMELEHDFNVCREHGHGSLESSLEALDDTIPGRLSSGLWSSPNLLSYALLAVTSSPCI